MERFLSLIIGNNIPPTLIVPQLELDNARRSTTIADVIGWEDGNDPYQILADLIIRSRSSTGTVVLGVEKSHLTLSHVDQITSAVSDVSFVDIAPTLGMMRQIKDASELEALTAAAAIADRAAATGLATLVEGKAEYEIAAAIESTIRSEGDRQTSFPPLVQSGPNAAYPHGATSDRLLTAGDLVVMDLGGRYNGYCSDITRTGAVRSIDNRSRAIFTAVLDAQQYAFEAVRPGVTATEVDRAARRHLAAKGLDNYFIHRTGHGIGIDVHEYPYIGANDQVTLQPGMTFSIEPGVYIPDWGGVRIEDIVVVTDDGCRRLNECPRNILT